MVKGVRGSQDAKILFFGRTPSALDVGGRKPFKLMWCNGTPIESLDCGRTPRTVVNMVVLGKKNKTEFELQVMY